MNIKTLRIGLVCQILNQKLGHTTPEEIAETADSVSEWYDKNENKLKNIDVRLIAALYLKEV